MKKKFKIRWMTPATRDLESIRDDISQDDPKMAIKIVIDIITKVESFITNNPSIGRAGRIAGTRELILANYPFIVPYRIRDDIIEILRVLHTAKSWPQKL